MAALISEHAIEFNDQFGTDADFDWTEVDKIMIEKKEKEKQTRKTRKTGRRWTSCWMPN